MKIGIVGAGGTGGPIGVYLALAGQEVTFIARGRHLAAMRENGLTLRTSHRGDIHLQPVHACTMGEYQETPDVIFVCVKYYSIPESIAFVRRAAGPQTLVVPILNVFGTGEVMQQQLPGITVLDGCVYIYGLVSAPGVIDQPEPILRIFYGYRDGQPHALEPLAKQLETVLTAAGIEGHFTDHIHRDALQKFSFVSPLGAAGLYFNAAGGDFQRPGRERDMFIGLVREVSRLGEAMGISFAEDPVAVNLKLLMSLTPELHTSMQRDVAKGGDSEFAGLVHHVVELGERYHIPLPLYRKISDWGKARGIR